MPISIKRSQYKSCIIPYLSSKAGRPLEKDVISNYTVTSSIECGHICFKNKDCNTFTHRTATQDSDINCKTSGDTSELMVKNQNDDETWKNYRIIIPVSHTAALGGAFIQRGVFGLRIFDENL